MKELSKDLREVLAKVGTSTLTGVLNRRGLKSMTLFDVRPVRRRAAGDGRHRLHHALHPLARGQGRADLDQPHMVQPQAMEECPPGHVLMIDSRGDSRAASAGDLYIGRLKARGAAGVVTDGGFRDTNGVFKTGLPAYHRRPPRRPVPIAHRPVDLQLPIACGGVAVYPGDIVVGDRDAVLVIPPDIVEAVAEEALKNYEYEELGRDRGRQGPLAQGPVPGRRRPGQGRLRGVEEGRREEVEANPPHSYGEVSASYADGGVRSSSRGGAYDPSVTVRRRHLPI